MLYVIQLKRLDEINLAKQMYQEQREQGRPGLAQDVSEDLNDNDIPKEKVKKEIFYHHYKVMKEDMAELTKLKDIKNEDLREVQYYMKYCAIEQTRLKLSLRSKIYIFFCKLTRQV